MIHVASWASRFLFTGEQLNQPVERLSGGERARVLIANLMLQPADLLLLDEPTNDLGHPDARDTGREPARVSRRARAGDTRSLHARSRFDDRAGAGWPRQCRAICRLSVSGKSGRSTSCGREAGNPLLCLPPKPTRTMAPPLARRRRSSRILRHGNSPDIEEKVEVAEELLQARREAVEDPAVATDGVRLQEALTALDEAQSAVDTLYARWAELEAKRA